MTWDQQWSWDGVLCLDMACCLRIQNFELCWSESKSCLCYLLTKSSQASSSLFSSLSLPLLCRENHFPLFLPHKII